MTRSGLVALVAVVAAADVLYAAPSKYLDDFAFLEKTVASEYAALKSKSVDWKAECAKAKPAFAACTSDVEHVKNVMRLLAVLKDSHTGVTDAKVDWKQMPSKWDGLYGAGLWIGWDKGRLVVMGMMQGHPLRDTLPLGSTIVAVDGVPAWLAMEREKRRITEFQGSSSDHGLFASMDNRMLPFGEKRDVELLVLTPEGKTKKVAAPRWGPEGKAFYPSQDTLPEGVAWKEGAVAKTIETKWSKRVGYVRITGSMDDATVAAFDAAFDSLKGMTACLLDCRGMGGGGDPQAWAMAGRFFKGGAANGNQGRIEPTGSWQFDGPVVMLQDSQEVSSAETFTWAMSETGRVVSVGTQTGGWGIIPHGFSCPSGLVSFRLGVNDRATPIKGVHTEGVGWPPDVLVPFGPVIRSRDDPVREIGLTILGVLDAEAKADKVRELFGGLFAGRIAEFKKAAPYGADLKVFVLQNANGFNPGALARLVEDDLKKRLEMETALLKVEDAGPPDALGAKARLAAIEPVANAAGMKSALADFAAAVKRLAGEASAQEAFLAATDRSLNMADADKKKFLAAWKDSQIAKFAREKLWK